MKIFLAAIFAFVFIISFATGLGFNAAGFLFLAFTNLLLLIFYFAEKDKAEKRQREINRYRKNGVRSRILPLESFQKN